MKKGLIILFTGDGKGKTSAVLGQVFRAIGHGMKICMIQFVKGKWKTGEMKTAEKFSDLLEFHIMGKGFTFNSANRDKHIKAGKDAWEFAKKRIFSDKYEIVVLDELTYLIKYKIIKEEELLLILRNKPKRLHIFITGRDATKGLIESSDLVSKIENIKHPFQKGINAQKGIEF